MIERNKSRNCWTSIATSYAYNGLHITPIHDHIKAKFLRLMAWNVISAGFTAWLIQCWRSNNIFVHEKYFRVQVQLGGLKDV